MNQEHKTLYVFNILFVKLHLLIAGYVQSEEFCLLEDDL